MTTIKKKCSVVMLATSKESNLFLDDFKKLHFHHSAISKRYKNNPKRKQHLYILSDEGIQDGDWCYNKITKQITQAKTHYYGNFNWVKIIATTDASLMKQDYFNDGRKAGMEQVPQIPQSFIEEYISEYNKDNQIKEVMVEYNFREWLAGEVGDNEIWANEEILKLSKDNTITITKVKDSYSKEEVEKL